MEPLLGRSVVAIGHQGRESRTDWVLQAFEGMRQEMDEVRVDPVILLRRLAVVIADGDGHIGG